MDDDVPVFASLDAIDVPFEAVLLATPNGLHEAGVLEAARLGKHVLTEKVLGIDRPSMDRMIEACEKARVTLGVTYQRRTSPDNIALKRLLDERALGRVYAVTVDVKFARDASYYAQAEYRGKLALDGGGAFLQQAAHQADLLCWFFGLPTHVTSRLVTNKHAIEVEDHGTALLSYEDGMLVTFTASTLCEPGFPPRIELYAERGTVILENDRIVLWNVDGIDNPSDATFCPHGGHASAAVEDLAGHVAIVTDFAQAIRDDREPLVPGREARLATTLILRIYEASKQPGH